MKGFKDLTVMKNVISHIQGKRTSDKIHALFPDEREHGGKKSSTKPNLVPQSLNNAWMRCAEGFDGCQAEKSSRSSGRKSKTAQLLAHSVVFDEETSADESQKDPADIVWSSSDNEWSNDGSNHTISQPAISDLSPQSASRSQDLNSSYDRSNAGDVPQITDWQEDSDLECDHEGSASEAAESEVEISDTDSVSNDVSVSRRLIDVQSVKTADIVEYSSDDLPEEPTVSSIEVVSSIGNDVNAGGKSASDWLKTAQVLLQTPEKKADAKFKTPEDSAKKKKRFLRQKLQPQNLNTPVIINTHFSQRIMVMEGSENKTPCASITHVKKLPIPLSLTLDLGNLGVCSDKLQVSSISSHIQGSVSIQDKEFTSSITVNDSLLDLVETQGAAGWKDAYIHVVVQRVYHLTSKDSTCSLLQTKNIKTNADTSTNSQRADCRMGLLVQDAYGIFSELQVQFIHTPIDEMKEYCQTLEGKACRLLGIKVLQRTTRGRAPGLFSLIDSLWPPLAPIKIHGQSQEPAQVPDNLPAPSFCYVLAIHHEKGGDNIMQGNAITDLYLPPVTHSLEEVLQMPALSQRCSFSATLTYVKPEIQSNLPRQKELLLYVTDTSLQLAAETSRNPRVLKVCVLPSCALDRTLQEIFSKKIPCNIFFKDAVHENSGIICVERTVLSLQKPLLSCTSGTSERTGPVRLDGLDSSTEANTICTVKGLVVGVNESESYSWPVCNLCGSSKLQPLTQKSCPYHCCQCTSDISSPVIRMQLEVFLQCEARPQCKVRLKLREETISSLLGSCSSEDGRYERSAVLGKELGPVHCYVLCAANSLSLEEIRLLQAG
ncbi:DNA repair-scaffolding protein isoform X3 [Engystomops pustulosus]|uniref:DNA repair-scaffolding protein isoform X3 n=1 Tax=Engystomops pustulosus TaxID=76066 RepID=UPI003AFAB565